MLTGIFLVGIGILFGLPGLAYILLFYNEQKKKSVPLEDTARLISLAHDISDMDTSRLLRSAHRLALKLERASQDSMQGVTKSLDILPKAVTQPADTDPGKKMRSFSEFVCIKHLLIDLSCTLVDRNYQAHHTTSLLLDC